MPRKPMYTREEILDCAYQMVRREGIETLSARNLARELDTSVAPIFTAFSSIDELISAVVDRAKALYDKYVSEGLSESLPFKGAGMKYIEFAKDEPKLFKLLFMSDNTYPRDTGYFPSGDSNEASVRGALSLTHGISDPTARNIYNYMSVFVHGLAVTYAGGNGVFSDEELVSTVSQAFYALKDYFKENKEN